MALPEHRKEQAQWHARLARERLDLSASVNETLAETSSPEEYSLGGDDSSLHTSGKVSLVPPRLSLQSKLLPAVRPSTQEMQSPAHTQAAPLDMAGEQKAPHAPNILTRVVRGITSSLAAFGASKQPLAPPVPPSQESFSEYERASILQGEIDSPFEPPGSSSVPIIDALPSAHPRVESALPLQSKQRLAGHTGKIRLQTASLPVVAPPPVPREGPPAETAGYGHGEVREPVEVRVRLSTDERGKEFITASVPRADALQRDSGTTMSQRPPADALGSGPVGRGMLSGSGMFESGQRDVMIPNSHITASSVVVPMLTSNPGPVVVQYVSLHPHIGFTLHLTAPATAKTSFNYIILLGELF